MSKRFGSLLNLIVSLSMLMALFIVGPVSAEQGPPPEWPGPLGTPDAFEAARPLSDTALTQEQALKKVDPALRDTAVAGGEDVIDVYVSVRGGADLSAFLSDIIVRPEVFPGLRYVFGKITASMLMKLAFQPGVISVVDGSLKELERPYDPESEDAPDLTSVQARMDYLKANELTYAEAAARAGQVGASGWWDVDDGHKSGKAWEKGFTGEGVILGVIDDGVDYGHPDLQGTQAMVSDPGSPYYGWPMAFSQASVQYFAYDAFLGTNYIASGAVSSRWSDTQTSETPANGTVPFQPLGAGSSFNYTHTGTSLSGTYKLGSFPEMNLAGLYGHRVAVLVVDENIAGVYDTVYVDLDNDKDFTDEKPATKASPEIYRDMDGDTFADISGGLLVWISDGANPPPVTDWLWGVSCAISSPTIDGCPASGELVLFQGSFRSGYTHGTQCASNVAGQGVVNGGLTAQPFRFGGMVQGAAPDVGVMDFGDFYITFADEDHYLVAGLGYDGIPMSGDEVQVTTNSYGSFRQMWGGWGYTGRLLTALNTSLAPYTTYVFSAGNEGPGYGPQEGDGSPTTIQVGSSTQYGSTNWDSIFGADQIMYGDPNSFFSHGPNRDGSSGLDVLANGGRGAGDEGINYFGYDGYLSWATWGGTSRSAPVAGGNLALVYQAFMARNGRWPTWQEAKTLLKSGATNSVSSPFFQGAGVVNSDRATDLAGGLYGVYAMPDEWQVGDWQGTEYLNFAKVAFPGDTFMKTYEVYNPSGYDITVDLSDGVMEKIGSEEYTFTTASLAEESNFNFHSPDYLMPLPTGDIPLDTEVMIVRYVHPYDTFDPSYDFTPLPDSSWRYLLYNWKDFNDDGMLWEDFNLNGAVNRVDDVASGPDNDGFLRPDFSDPATEIQEGEYVRVDYEFGGSGIQMIVRDPLGRMEDGYFFGWQHRYSSPSVDKTSFKIGVEFYKKADWDWLSLSTSSLNVPPESMATFDATMDVPFNAKPGAYEGVIYMNDPGNEFDHPSHETALPVVVNVIANLPDDGFKRLGGEPMSDTMYQNSWTNGYFNWYGGGWTGAGDWRHYFLNIDENDLENSNLLLHTWWNDGYPTDINTWVLGPTEDCASNGVGPCAFWEPGVGQPNPGVYGPYTLQPIASSGPFMAGAAYPFETSTGGPDDWLLVPLEQEGLHEVALHNVLYSGQNLAAQFGVDVGTINVEATMDPLSGTVELNSIDALAYFNEGQIDLHFTPTLGIPDLEGTLTGGLVTSFFGPFTSLVPDTGQCYSAWCPGNVYEPFIVDQVGATELNLVLEVPSGQDADMFLVYDANDNGIPEEGTDPVVGTSGNSAGEDEQITLANPTLGRYFATLDGYDVEPDSGVNLDWWYEVTAPGGLPVQENEFYSGTVAIYQDDPFDYTTASHTDSFITDERTAAIYWEVTDIPVGADVDLYVTQGSTVVASSTNAGNADEYIMIEPPEGEYRFGAGETFDFWVHGRSVPSEPVNPHLRVWTDDLNIWLSASHPDVIAHNIAPGETVSMTVNFQKDDWDVGNAALSARYIAGPTVLPGAFDELLTIERADPAVPSPFFTVDKWAESVHGPYPALLPDWYGLGQTGASLVAPLEPISYTIEVTNIGDAGGYFYIEDWYGDDYFDFDHWISTPPFSWGVDTVNFPGWEIPWFFEWLDPGATGTFEFVVNTTSNINQGFIYSNFADVWDPAQFPGGYIETAWWGAYYRSFNTSSSTGLPALSDKSSATAVPGAAAPGETFPYQISLVNPSSVDQYLYLTDALPGEVNYVSASPGVSYNPGTHTVSWEGNVPGDSLGGVDLEVVVQIKGATPETTLVYNEAEVRTDPAGEPIAYLSDMLEVDDGLDPSIHVDKVVDLLVGVFNQRLSYTIDVWNSGPETAFNVELIDTLPPGVEIDLSSITGGAWYSAGAIHWMDDIPTGVTYTITYDVIIKDAPLKWALINGAMVTADNFWGYVFDSAATEVIGGLFYLPFIAGD